MAWTVDQDTDDQRNRIAGLLMAMDVGEHAPIDIFPHSPAPGDQLALSQLSDPDAAVSDKTFGPITSPSENTPNFTDFDFGDKGQPSDAGKSSGIFDPGAMTTSMASMTTGVKDAGHANFTDMVNPSDESVATTHQQSSPLAVFDYAPEDFSTMADRAMVGQPDFGAPPSGTLFGETDMFGNPTPAAVTDEPGDFASMNSPAAAAFSAGFDAGAASVGGQGEGAGQGDTTGGSSSSDSSSSSGDNTGGSSGVG